MRILITNDDGMNAAQLPGLIRWCRNLGEVTTVVPKFEQSGKSHGIEIHKAFEAKEVAITPDITLWAVDSTPADCVRFAVLGLHMEFDLVISGINRGLNIGADIMYSGTVGAIFEAKSLGIPGIALSTTPEYYNRALTQLDRVFGFLRQRRLMEYGDLYNINIPGPSDDIFITRQGGPYYSDDYEPIGNGMYHPRGKSVWEDRGDFSLDTDATLHGCISITPLTMDRTDLAVFRKLKG